MADWKPTPFYKKVRSLVFFIVVVLPLLFVAAHMLTRKGVL